MGSRIHATVKISARERTHGIIYGCSGVASTIHFSGAYLLNRAVVQRTHVSFGGEAQTITALLSGDLQLAVNNLASFVGLVQEGRMRALAGTTPEHWPALTRCADNGRGRDK